jgi:predicted nucleotidyltransferase
LFLKVFKDNVIIVVETYINVSYQNLLFDMFTEKQKRLMKQQLVDSLRTESEICRIVIFGSFVNSDNPRDLDVAVFQDSDNKYLPLAMKYRKKTRELARIIPLDIIPLKAGVKDGFFMDEIESGEVIYERAD